MKNLAESNAKKTSKMIETDPWKMKTYLRIPFERAPEDP